MEAHTTLITGSLRIFLLLLTKLTELVRYPNFLSTCKSRLSARQWQNLQPEHQLHILKPLQYLKTCKYCERSLCIPNRGQAKYVRVSSITWTNSVGC